jgi:dienelactone hydrolase
VTTIATSNQSSRQESGCDRKWSAWSALRGWWQRQWAALNPGPEARRGALCGTLVFVAIFAIEDVISQPSGFGLAVDVGFTIALSVVVITVITLVVALFIVIVRQLPLLCTGVLLGSSGLMAIASVAQPSPRLYLLALAFCLAGATMGGAIATIRLKRFAQSSIPSRAAAYILLVVAAVYGIGFVWILADDGSDTNLTSWRPRGDASSTLAADNPSTTGPYAVKTLFYGTGTDIRRPEYGPSVAIRTRTVDASRFFRGVGGWTRWVRRQYWGFDLDKLPLNARVWYPDGPGTFPLVLIVHGNHSMVDFSDPGYGYLGELLASRGFILASVDENFLNGSAGTVYRPAARQLVTERTVRAWMLLEHLRLWHDWNQDSANPFFRKVDVNRIALMGHSRGGEAAATAALFNRLKYYPEDANVRFDYGFDLRAIVAIAPPDGQYEPTGQQRWIEDISYLTLQGAHDADESTFGGSRQADRVRYTRPGSWFSAEIWAYRANHGQFNTSWGRMDFPAPLGWFLNREQLMTGDEQRQISKTYIAAFLETALRDRREYLPLFKDWRTGRQWLPDTIYINRYRDASFVPVATFQEDADLASPTAIGGEIKGEGLTLWREGRIPMRQGDRGYNGVFLGWHRTPGGTPARYSISFPADAARKWQLSEHSIIELSVAAMDQDAPVPPGITARTTAVTHREAPDFTIELIGSDGTTAAATVSQFGELPPPLMERFTKLGFVERDQYEKQWEPVFQTIRIPVSSLASGDGPRFDLQKLVGVQLKFDRTASSVICISGIGFGAE